MLYSAGILPSAVTMTWHYRSLTEIYDELETNETGLDEKTADERRASVGSNEIIGDQGPKPTQILLAQFSSALIWVLLVAARLSLAIGHVVDAVLIGIIVLLNGAEVPKIDQQ